MDGGTLLGRLDRIEAALDRIEAQATRIDAERLEDRSALAQPDTDMPDADPQHADPQHLDLQDRHTALQESVRTALARLDVLIHADPIDTGSDT